MIRSMTAYARREIKGDWGSAAWELRSVNQRYLETYFRLPEQFRSLEPVVRERIRARLTRGKVGRQSPSSTCMPARLGTCTVGMHNVAILWVASQDIRDNLADKPVGRYPCRCS